MKRPKFLSSIPHCFPAISAGSQCSFRAEFCCMGAIVTCELQGLWMASLCFNLPKSQVKWVFFFYFYLIIGSHYMAKASFEFSICSRLTLSSRRFSCLSCLGSRWQALASTPGFLMWSCCRWIYSELETTSTSIQHHPLQPGQLACALA